MGLPEFHSVKQTWNHALSHAANRTGTYRVLRTEGIAVSYDLVILMEFTDWGRWMHNQTVTTHCDECWIGGKPGRGPYLRWRAISRGYLEEVISKS